MLRLDDIVWESEASGMPVHTKQTVKKKGTKQSKQKKIHHGQNKLLHGKTSKQAAIVEQSESSSPYEEATSKYKGASLKDLNPQDKERIAHLIKELAKADEEKENIVYTLHNERQQFLSQVKELENDKLMLLNRQDFLAEEVKQCQTLLQYYQNLITMQQTSILAQEESKIQDEESSSVIIENHPSMQSSSSRCKNMSFNEPEHVTGMSADELSSQLDRIRVNEFENTDSSFTEDQILHMNDQQYRSYLERKKLRLKREQERLRKLLEIKVKNSDLSDIEVSPVRDIIDKELERSIKEVSDIGNNILEKRAFGSPNLKHSGQSSPMPAAKSNSFYTPTRNKHMPASNHCTPTVKKDSFHTPIREHSLSQSNVSKKSDSKSRLTSTLKSSTSPDMLFDALTDDRCEVNRSMLGTIPYENVLPTATGLSQCSIHSNDAAIATDLLSCDDSQILQEIFFV